jgi:hypothetical protein
MGGAYGGTNVGGIGLQIVDSTEPDITVVTFMDRTKVYIRRTKTWKEAFAEFVHPGHAAAFAQLLQENKLDG